MGKDFQPANHFHFNFVTDSVSHVGLECRSKNMYDPQQKIKTHTSQLIFSSHNKLISVKSYELNRKASFMCVTIVI